MVVMPGHYKLVASAVIMPGHYSLAAFAVNYDRTRTVIGSYFKPAGQLRLMIPASAADVFSLTPALSI